VLAKFRHNAELADKLVATTGALLVEGNTWHDQIWGHVAATTTATLPARMHSVSS
jgi:predicted NAD-dependent protein-ADP-ribosyltransferase YbiA (DUF1768 family)